MEKKYDITIIGSGLSGLICGYILSKEGYKVCILEKNKQFGGCLQTFVRDRCIFDVGVHYIGGLAEGQSLNQYFKYLGIMDDLKLQRMDMDAFDVISFEGNPTAYKMAQGHERFIDSLSEQFPTERIAIKNYNKAIQDICKQFPLYHLEVDKAYPTNFEHLMINAKDKIASLTSNPTLQAVLAGNNILYAGRGSATPFYLHAMVLNSYIESAWRCVDGGSQIARLLVKNIRANGGDIFKRKEVDQFVFDGAKIKAVRLTTGEEITTKEVISSAHPTQLSRFVRGQNGHLRKAYLNRINNIKATPSVFSAHYTLKPNTVKYINRNHYHNKTTAMWDAIDYNQKNWPSTYLALTPNVSKNSIYADSFAAMCYMDYQEVQQWGNTFNTVSNEQSRGEDYEAFKQEKAAALLEQLYKQFPQLKGNISNTYVSTPLSFRDYIGCPTGSLYGFERNYKDPMRTALAVQTRIPNLSLTGQNVNVHGILGVTVSGILACLKFTDRKKLLTDIVSAT
ncbi:phytoene desaturase family protein [Aureispira anguillae]|uniref:NAD(P)/FAD-dependent oxidoreductase n=1 Tax=Aureispira anguillae TaxID=2864201 RepID=A0A915YLS6_9BACT|nr:NAD(P)/FAD-dependent oxidoreductase [Aureispira anguillae]BDS15569.1 NAD(P)/FAD-dependent oxidoreductase [Aureispira anguillae]